ncbi:glucosaminidase domain-containing protein [Pedobacter sp. SL55]|uniref:glucosaminidase domain and LysM peptidoglycan-binding domain-containing protein n=1 Tax=Pedobacter sp. SL55 TaxID=2995161 RepID=UPI00226EE847|nr:glucosaminidase domain-containing protein [Pedobacter sp. SL55]WAC41755.1 glucosaminidase domain-containing protein [Pedobacter sp. SL55]
MKKIILLVILAVNAFLASAQTTEEYIEEYADIAQELAKEHHIPASIILGVAIHESAAGKSKIARYLNNHFGFKGKNSNTEIRSAYKDFPTVDSSYVHFITFLKSRTYFNVLFDKYDAYNFKAWARGIQRGGYARSRSWASQVIALINKYELFQYDNRPEDYVEPVEPKPIYRPKKKSSRTYTVKQGDNLSIIAKRNKTTVKALMNKNGLKSNALKPGQKLKL